MKNKKGFTLVELLAVIAILAILVIIAMPNVLGLFTKSRIKTNLIVVENYATVGEEYFTSQFGESSDFNGKINVASKLSITGKRADVEKVYVTKDGEVAVYLQIDNYCYYKPFGAEEAIYTENIELCDTDTYISGMPIVPVKNGSGLYDDGDRLVYKSNTSSISGSMYNTYCNYNFDEEPRRNSTSDCDGKEILNNSKYSELIKQEDDVNNWIYFNCKDYTDVSTCEKWRIISYNYDENGNGNLKLISPDIRNTHIDESKIDNLVANNRYISDDLINNFNKLYYDEYLTDSAKSLITKSTYYSGNLSTNGSKNIIFPNDVVQTYYSWNINDIYDSSFEAYFGYLDAYEWFSASTNNICLQGMEHLSDYSSYNVEDIVYSECNNWLNDGSFYKLNNNAFVGELGTVSSRSMNAGVRPVITLKSGSYIISGDGTNSNPYVLKYNDVKHVLTLKEEFLEKVKKMYVDANNSSLSTLYYASDNHKLNGYDDLEYVIQKENGKVNSMIVKSYSNVYKLSKKDNFENFSEDDISTGNYSTLMGLESVVSWYNNCQNNSSLRCKIIQYAYISKLLDNNKSDENNDGLGDRIYYFNGMYNYASMKNYVIFANYCWRIVRTNENGDVKLIFNGSPSSGACSTTLKNSIGTTSFNSSAFNRKYISDGNDSNIKILLDTWYVNNILTQGENVYSKIVDTIYCNDITNTAKTRLNNRNHSYKCVNNSSQYTLSKDSGGKENYGNNLLIYPIGLLTSDELYYSGIKPSYTAKSFLSASFNYFTLTSYNNSKMFAYTTSYGQYDIITSTKNSTIPVITIKGDIIVSSGTGTASNPYVIN